MRTTKTTNYILELVQFHNDLISITAIIILFYKKIFAIDSQRLASEKMIPQSGKQLNKGKGILPTLTPIAAKTMAKLSL